MAEERLQKYLARAGVASRRHAEELITAGRVMVNNEKVTELGSRVDPDKDMVTVDGQLAQPPEKTSYYLLYKPVGVVTTLSDPQGRPTVASYLEETGKRLFPVGRLDYDAEGALLFTDDGALAHKLTHPSFQVPRTYLSKVKGVPTHATLEKLRGGVRLEDGMATPVSVDVFEAAERNTWLKIVVAEGRPHLIKRLCAAVGHPVVRLYRPSYAGVGVEGLRPGQLRPLTQSEVTLLEGVSEGRIQAPADSLKLPPRRHGRAAPGFESEDFDEGEDDMDDEAPKKRPARKAAPEKSRGSAERGPAKRAPREERKPRTEGGTGIARFNRVRGGEEEGGRPERREWKPRAEGAGRPARGGFGGERAERPARRSFGEGSERPARRSFGEGSERPARRSFGEGSERPARRSFGEGSERPARRSFGEGSERPARRGFGGEGADRPARRSFGGEGAGRPERRSFGGAGAGRPERRGFGGEEGGRPERREWKPRGEGADRPARRGFGGEGEGRPARRSFGGEGGGRPERRGFGGEGAGRPERRSFGGAGAGRPERRSFGGEGADRPARRSFGGEGAGRPERREWKPRGEGAGRPERRSFGGEGGSRPERREWKPRGEGAGRAERGPRSEPGAAPRGRGFGGADRGERSPRGSAGARGARGEAGSEKPAYQDWKAKKTKGSETQWSSRAPRGGAGRGAGRPSPKGGPRRPR